MFIPMTLITSGKSSSGVDVNLVNNENGLCGALLVFKTYEQAKLFYPDSEIVECDIVEKPKQE